MWTPGKKRVGMAAVLVLLTVLVYGPAMRGGFVWDDDWLLTENPVVLAADGPLRAWQINAGLDYYPITWMTFWVEWRLWGMNPAGYHVTNVLLHVLGALLVWKVLERLKIYGAWLVALVFAVHPVNVESVAWIAERKNTLSLVFYALTMLAYLKYERESRGRWYGGAVCLFVVALLSKTTGVMLPGVFLLCAWWQRGRIDRRDLLRALPFFMLAAAFGWLTIWTQGKMSGEAVPEAMQRSLMFRSGAAGHVFWFYLLKTLIPVNLMTIYPLWDFNSPTALFWLPTLAAAAALGIALVYRATWGRGVLFGLVYFGVMLFPVLGVFNKPYSGRSPVVTDHLQYLATIGIIGLVVGGATHFRAANKRLNQTATTGVAVALVAVCCGLSWQRAFSYQDQEKLWTDTLVKNPGAGKAHFNLGVTLDKHRRYAEAEAHYREAIRLNPADALAMINLANVLVKTGQFETALPSYAAAVRLRPTWAEAHGNWANALAHLGRADEAAAQFAEALRLKPDSAEIRYNLGVAEFAKGNVTEAMTHLIEAVRLKPDNAGAHYQLGLALAAQRRFDDALTQFSVTISLQSDHAAAHSNLGNALAALGQPDRALAEYAAAVRYNPEFAEAHYNWGLALARRGQMTEAINHFTEAVRLNPHDAPGQNNLGVAFAQMGKISEARAHFAEAVRLKPDDPDYRRNLDQSRQGGAP